MLGTYRRNKYIPRSTFKKKVSNNYKKEKKNHYEVRILLLHCIAPVSKPVQINLQEQILP